MNTYRWAGFVVLVMVASVFSTAFAQKVEDSTNDTVELRVNTGCFGDVGSVDDALRRAFHKMHPNVELVVKGRKEIGAGKLRDNTSEVVYVNYRLAGPFVKNKDLYPIDKYLEKALDIDVENGPTLSTDEYIKQLQKSPKYKDNLQRQISRMTWDVIRRKCPYGLACPYCKEWGVKPTKEHYHVWALPHNQVVMGMYYDKAMLKKAGLPDRTPETLEELLRWALKLTDRKKNQYGLFFRSKSISWSMLSILQSMGGRLMEQDKTGLWWYTFDSDQAVDAYYLVAQLFYSTASDGSTGAVFEGNTWEKEPRIGMVFYYLNSSFFTDRFWSIRGAAGFGSVPAGPDGKRHPEANALMQGISASTKDKKLRDLAWDFIWFRNCPKAEKIAVDTYIHQDLAKFVHPDLLKATGHADLVSEVPAKWVKDYNTAWVGAIPEPYVTCHLNNSIYTAPNKAIDELIKDPDVIKAVKNGDAKTAKVKIKQILKAHTEKANSQLRKAYGMEK